MDKPHDKRLLAREIISLIGLIALADATIYRGHGYAGLGLLAAGAPLLIWLGTRQRRAGTHVLLPGLMLAVLGLRLAWCGDQLQVLAAISLVAAFGAASAGVVPHVLETAVFASQTIQSGFVELGSQFDYMRQARLGGYRIRWLSVVLPAGALILFGLLFTLANPDLLSAMGENLQRFARAIRRLFSAMLPRPAEVLLWVAVGWIGLGAIRPLMKAAVLEEDEAEPSDLVESPLLHPFRNTLLAVIALFAAYLMFEFKTLWFRRFPPGFHYSGYAHEGAAWLTIALGLATVMLSAVFRGSILADPRCPQLQKLAWIWCGENLLLAVAVFNRLNIYVGFNGMTRMRVIGYFGISAVVGGLLVVVWKIVHRKNFRWLIRRQLWVLGAAVYLYAVAPVDSWAMGYNVRRILAGDSAPSVQISVHPINDEGYLELPPLLSATDAKVREGVRAMLHQRRLDLERQQRDRRQMGWTAIQWSRSRLAARLNSLQPEFTQKTVDRESARQEFDAYAYQWY